MSLPIPYARVVGVAVAAAIVLAVLLNQVVRDWAGALHLALVIVVQVITLVLAVRSLVIWIIRRRRRGDDPGGQQENYGLAA